MGCCADARLPVYRVVKTGIPESQASTGGGAQDPSRAPEMGGRRGVVCGSPELPRRSKCPDR